jgi:hypothetical protein
MRCRRTSGATSDGGLAGDRRVNRPSCGGQQLGARPDEMAQQKPNAGADGERAEQGDTAQPVAQ